MVGSSLPTRIAIQSHAPLRQGVFVPLPQPIIEQGGVEGDMIKVAPAIEVSSRTGVQVWAVVSFQKLGEWIPWSWYGAHKTTFSIVPWYERNTLSSTIHPASVCSNVILPVRPLPGPLYSPYSASFYFPALILISNSYCYLSPTIRLICSGLVVLLHHPEEGLAQDRSLANVSEISSIYVPTMCTSIELLWEQKSMDT